MTQLDQFIKINDGKPLETEDAANLDQCFDLAFGWTDNLAIPRSTIRHLYAYQIFTNPSAETYQYFDLINNTPTGVPQAGDLIIWGTGVGIAGHVALFISGDMNNFKSFDQNWNGKKFCTTVSHGYTSVLGWLHPKPAIIAQPTPQPPAVLTITDQTKIPQIENREVQSIRSELSDLRTQNQDLKNQLLMAKNTPQSPVTSQPVFINPIAKTLYQIALQLG